MPRFSIIVPYFNNSNTLPDCIQSVLFQVFPDWELILVDDGSDDGGALVYDDSRIKSFRQNHRGVSTARNRGIRESTGDYLLFLDADDYIGKNYLQDFANHLFAGAPDICLSGLTRIERDGSSRTLMFPFTGVVSKETLLPSFYEIQRTNQLYGYVAAKAVRRAFLTEHQLLFNEQLHKSEDLDFFLRCYEKCSVFLFIPNMDYHYIKYDGGSSMYRQESDYFSLITVHRHLRSFCCNQLSDADEASYRKTMSAWIDSAILETPLNQLKMLPGTLRRISQDPELRALCHVNGSSFRLTIMVFLRQIRLFFAHLLYQLCSK